VSYQAIEHLFRHEYGQLVALLSRRVGVQRIEAVEDAVQWAMAQALDKWTSSTNPQTALPESPSGWLYQVSYRHLISELRSTKRKNDLLQENVADFVAEYEERSSVGMEAGESGFIALKGELKDSLLRMLFFTCDNSIPVESQLVFTLKSLCGFSIKEIAVRLFISEENSYKRYNRARKYLKAHSEEFRIFAAAELSDKELMSRLNSVHRVLYLVFTEGYLSSHAELSIRKDLCEESLRLALILNDSKVGRVPETSALVALMYFHLARLDARKEDSGALQLFEEQDRSCWNKELIARGLFFLDESTNSKSISRYHVEAGIAAEHCMTKSYKDTCWDKIVNSYLLLEKIAPSPIHLLNRAIATAEWKGAQAGINVLKSSKVPAWLEKSYHWYAILADLNMRIGNKSSGEYYAKLALAASPSKEVNELLKKRFANINNSVTD